VSGYVLDDLALIMGLTAKGAEQDRRELSRFLVAAIHGGPAIAVPALCLCAAVVHRAEVADHLAELVAGSPVGAVEIVGLTRTAEVAQLRAEHPGLSWPALHAAAVAASARIPVVTTEPARYTSTVIEAIRL
jgi:hypothetical protein